MNDTITGFDISSDNINSVPIVGYLDTAILILYEINVFTVKGTHCSSCNISSYNCSACDDMSGNDSFGLIQSQALQGSSW